MGIERGQFPASKNGRSRAQRELTALTEISQRPARWDKNLTGHITNTSGYDFRKGRLLQQPDDFRMARTCRNVGGRLAFLVHLARICTALQQGLDHLGMSLLRGHHQCRVTLNVPDIGIRVTLQQIADDTRQTISSRP